MYNYHGILFKKIWLNFLFINLQTNNLFFPTVHYLDITGFVTSLNSRHKNRPPGISTLYASSNACQINKKKHHMNKIIKTW